MVYKRIDHVAINVSDLEASKEFYERHFGFRTYFEHDTPAGFDILYLQLADTVLELVGRGEAISGFHFCLETDDFDAAFASLSDAGVPVLQPPHDVPARLPREADWMRVVFVGPDGEQIELRGPSLCVGN